MRTSSTDDVNDKSPRTNDSEMIASLFEGKYTETYSKKVIDEQLLKDTMSKMNFSLSESHIKILNKRVDPSEIEEVLKDATSGVSPGLDRLRYNAYKQHPDVSAQFLARIANIMANSAKVPPSFLENEVVLLHKEEKVWHTGQFRPITLTNSDYKIILNVWARRLGGILNEIVGEHQKGFIPGRDGRENVIVVQACLDKLSNKKEGGIIFLDLEKAFDRVSHEALFMLLEGFKFPTLFIKTIKGIYNNSNVTIKVNDTTTGEIPVRSGTNQGCPISPLLFTIIAEVLTQQIVNDPEFRGAKLNIIRKKVSAYTDDTVIICKNLADFKIALKHLRAYETATGMKQNVKKTEIVSNDCDILKAAKALRYSTPSESKYLELTPTTKLCGTKSCLKSPMLQAFGSPGPLP